MLGKQENCQVAMSTILACRTGRPAVGSVFWHRNAKDMACREKKGVLPDLEFPTKPAIAWVQMLCTACTELALHVSCAPPGSPAHAAPCPSSLTTLRLPIAASLAQACCPDSRDTGVKGKLRL
jgi:hypothetical protein